MNENNIQTKIRKILEETEFNELKKNIKHASIIHQTNIYLSYIFHLFQTSGILITTISTSYSSKQYLWLGIGLNFTASFFNAIERQNEILHKKILKKINLSRQKLIQYENIFLNDKLKSLKNNDIDIKIRNDIKKTIDEDNDNDNDYIKICSDNFDEENEGTN